MDTMTHKEVTVPFDDTETKYFTEYNCWALALEMNRLFGFDIAFYAATTSEDGEIEEDTLWSWSHAFNVLPDGRYIDIEGVHDAKFFTKYPVTKNFLLGEGEQWKHVGVIVPDHEDSLAMIELSSFNEKYVESIAYRVVGNYLLGK